ACVGRTAADRFADLARRCDCLFARRACRRSGAICSRRASKALPKISSSLFEARISLARRKSSRVLSLSVTLTRLAFLVIGRTMVRDSGAGIGVWIKTAEATADPPDAVEAPDTADDAADPAESTDAADPADAVDPEMKVAGPAHAAELVIGFWSG